MNFAIFISGAGSNLKNLILKTQKLTSTNISCVISSNQEAGGLEIAKSFDIPTHYLTVKKTTPATNYSNFILSNSQIINSIIEREKINKETSVIKALSPEIYSIHEQEIYKFFEARIDAENQILSILKEYDIDYILLAGFMRVLSPFFIKIWENKIINIHPSLLPAFKGTNAIKKALEHGAKITGVTVHTVSEQIDKGTILGQIPVEISNDETEQTLDKKIKIAESQLYPEILEALSKNQIKLT